MVQNYYHDANEVADRGELKTANANKHKLNLNQMRARLLLHLRQPSVAASRVLQRRTTSSIADSNPVADEQQDILQFTFSEEPLGLPASEGFGYFQGGPGLTLGPNSRFKLQAKLGFGTTSSVWLARDHMYDFSIAFTLHDRHVSPLLVTTCM